MAVGAVTNGTAVRVPSSTGTRAAIAAGGVALMAAVTTPLVHGAEATMPAVDASGVVPARAIKANASAVSVLAAAVASAAATISLGPIMAAGSSTAASA